jgi:hypothetical protein
MAGDIDAAGRSMVRNLEEKTGRTIDAWVALTRGLGDLKHGQIVKELKDRHGLTHGYANMVAHMARGVLADGAPAGDDLVAGQYAGGKEALRPIYDAVAKAVSAFGSDVELAPKKTYVSLRRAKQFGLVQPSTRTRVDLGLNLKGVAAQGRLEASGSFNSMCTHRVRLANAKDVDAEVIAWLRQAYEGA